MIMNALMTLLVIGLVGIGGLIYYAKSQFDTPGPLDHSTVIVIPKGEGVKEIAARLEEEGIIQDRRIFVASVIYFKAQDKLKAGEYEIRKSASMRDVLDKLVQGKAVLYKVSIPEGLTSQQIVERLNAESGLEGEIAAVPAEGSLLPDTYKYARGMTKQELLERMAAEQRKFVARIWDGRAKGLPIKTPDEALVLASIVEKETSRADERARIAKVFINRLDKKMRLQSDPTIIYGIVGGQGSLGRPILRSEIEAKTAYNTYQIDGLPPTPIANPGRAAIEAVLNPAETKDIYFVADGTGGHAFSATLDEHRTKVAKWREIEKEMRAKAEAAKAEEEAKKAAAAAGTETQTQAPAAGTENAAPNGALTSGAPPAGGGAPAIPGTVNLIELPGIDAASILPNGVLQLPAPAATPTTTAPAAVLPGAAGAPAGDVPLPKRNPRVR
ncbi:MAG: endolytic transglycosylase MltG [Pseudomonadota bacterium]|nr:endolytic transglycosylase MltG [Pseudomonadota bacterium]